jgi:hypothetical protein
MRFIHASKDEEEKFIIHFSCLERKQFEKDVLNASPRTRDLILVASAPLDVESENQNAMLDNFALWQENPGVPAIELLCARALEAAISDLGKFKSSRWETYIHFPIFAKTPEYRMECDALEFQRMYLFMDKIGEVGLFDVLKQGIVRLASHLLTN